MHTLPTPPHSLHFLFFCILFSYFLPTVVALLRRHVNAAGVFSVNLLFGWTGIGWLVAQIWSFTNDPPCAGAAPASAGTKILRVTAVVYYVLLLAFITLTGHRPAALRHAAGGAQQAQPAQMTPVPQSGVPAPASDLIGK
ncbi:MAG: superinfection immunity protein [Alphaproteobacteria bacterium]|nr:superinfection immunity protein [Alphaproteobacteria bacterium]MDE2337372.1 superinfection immunity protein [Alphaproteobacteria bacterium]